MVWNIILWVLFGALSGWIASMIMGTNAQQGAAGNIVVGILGALIGGWIVGLFGVSVSTFSLAGLLVAILGAVVLLFVVSLFRGGGRGAHHNV
jgi:uncharacterized membrane protein YeaQ/YmgE (transglycosylase-associated protein family)